MTSTASSADAHSASVPPAADSVADRDGAKPARRNGQPHAATTA